MKTLVVVNEKGGVGKTNLVAHAAWYFGERYRTLAIDLDQQANLTQTLPSYAGPLESVRLFSEMTVVAEASARPITLLRATRALLETERGDDGALTTFRDSLAASGNNYDICVVDTPPSLGLRSAAAILASDAILAPVGVNDYSLSGVTELVRAIRSVTHRFGRAEPRFLGLIPSIFDRKSRRERELFEQLSGYLGDQLFPGILAKRDAYAKAASECLPVWALGSASGREAGEEIRAVLARVEAGMELREHG